MKEKLRWFGDSGAPLLCVCVCEWLWGYLQVNTARQVDISWPIFSYLLTCALHCIEAAPGLSLWLLSYYRREVVSCHLCMISPSLNKGRCVSLSRAHTVIQCVCARVCVCHVLTPVHTSSWISLWAFTKHDICSLRSQRSCPLVFLLFLKIHRVSMRITADSRGEELISYS